MLVLKSLIVLMTATAATIAPRPATLQPRVHHQGSSYPHHYLATAFCFDLFNFCTTPHRENSHALFVFISHDKFAKGFQRSKSNRFQ
jgi:hypothetical protein